MDIRKIRKLIELMEETEMGEIEVTSGDDKVRIKKQSSASSQAIAYAPAPMAVPAPAAPAPAPAAAPAESSSTVPDGHQVKSPMVGTAYIASAPGEPPFVAIGQRVNVGDTICLIEAMKMFNKIEADRAGVVSACLINNEQPVEFDQPLFIIDSSE